MQLGKTRDVLLAADAEASVWEWDQVAERKVRTAFNRLWSARPDWQGAKS